MPYQNQRVSFAGKTNGFQMHLCDQRACRVNDAQSLAIGELMGLWWDAVGAENADGSIRHSLKALDKNNIALCEVLDYMTIVDNFVIDVDGRWKQLERALNNLHGPNHASAESSRISQQDLPDRHDYLYTFGIRKSSKMPIATAQQLLVFLWVGKSAGCHLWGATILP
jgi:hypothetical protein